MNPSLQQTHIEDILRAQLDPYLQQTWGEVDAIKEVVLMDEQLHVKVQLGYPILGLKQLYLELIAERLSSYSLYSLHIELTSKIASHVAQPGVPAIPGVKNVIAVASGKGGVGKSTTAVNLAVALAKEGARVGILDADIYGPNQPQMLGVKQRLTMENGQRLLPRLVHGVQSMSMGYLIDSETPMIWRGPMVSSALQQLAKDTAWGELDYLFIDLPPGTGDIQLTLAQKIPVQGVVVVTTPQEVALLDARKGLEMFRKVQVNILGVIENMGVHICEHCGHEEAIFGREGAVGLADTCQVELLGRLPLKKSIREQADWGVPLVEADPSSEVAGIYREIVRKITAKLSALPINRSSRFPKIVIENK